MIELDAYRHRDRNQKVLIIAVYSLICFTPIVHFVNQLCRTIFGAGFSMDTLICYGALAGVILAALRQLHFQIKIDVLLLVMVFALAYGLSYAFIEENKPFMFTEWTDFAANPLYQLFIYSLPGYVFMRYINDYDTLFETGRYFSLTVVFCSLGSFVLMSLRNTQPEYMSFSYNLLFGTIFSSIYFFEKKKVLSLIAAIIGVVMIFVFGARGPMVCYLFSLSVYFLMSKVSTAKKILLIFLIFSAGTVVLMLWQEMLVALRDSVESLGISSRTVEILLEGDVFSDSGRGEIQRKVAEGFTLFGRGLFGDRVLGGNRYSHNLIIELIAQWGYIFGILIIITLTVLFVKGFRTRDTNLQLLILALFSASVVKLMLSETYLRNAMFFVLIAACVNAVELPKPKAAKVAPDPLRKRSKYIRTVRWY